MKIALVSTAACGCGISGYTEYLADALTEIGHQPIVLGEETTENLPYRPPTIFCWNRKNSNSYVKLRNVIQEIRPDVVHWQYENALHNTSGPMYSMSLPIPQIMTWHNIVPDMKSRMYGGLMDQHIVHNQACVDGLSNFFGIPNDRCAALAHGTRKNEITSTDKAKELLGIPQDRVVLGMYGFTEVRKGYHLVLSAWKQLKKFCPDAFGMIVGGQHPKNPNTAYTDLITQAARQYPGDFKITGFTPDEKAIDLALSACDAFIFPHLMGNNILGCSGSVRRVLDHAKTTVVTDDLFHSDLGPQVIKIPQKASFLTLGKYIGRDVLGQLDTPQFEAQRKALKEYAIKTYWPEIAKYHINVYSKGFQKGY